MRWHVYFCPILLKKKCTLASLASFHTIEINCTSLMLSSLNSKKSWLDRASRWPRYAQEKLSSTVSVKLLDKQKQPVTGATVTIELWRMANSADDTTVPFTETAAGVYQAKLRLVDEGLWITDLQIARGQDHYSNKQSISVASE